MNATATLESIAGFLGNLPDDTAESMLVTFDTLTSLSGEAVRPVAAQLLRTAAESCQNPARRERLLSAAAAVAAGQPCALTPDGLTWKQAAAAQTVTQQEWEERVAQTPAPPLPGDIEESSKEAGEEETEDESEDSPYMEAEPPKLPHLPVRHFFSGLIVRVGCDFADANGRALCTGDVLTVLACEAKDDGFAVTFLDRTVRLSNTVDGHEAIAGNAGNAWFQPAPTAGCLEDLIEALDIRISLLEEDEPDDDSDYEAYVDRIDAIREDIERCETWLSQSGDRGPAPLCRSGSLAAKVFGRNRDVTAWIQLLFAAISVCIPDLG